MGREYPTWIVGHTPTQVKRKSPFHPLSNASLSSSAIARRSCGRPFPCKIAWLSYQAYLNKYR